MNDPEQLRELAWRRRLTPAEEAAWRASVEDGDSAAEVDTELALTESLSRLPNAPLSSNFTARVLDAVDREGKMRARATSANSWSWRRLLPRLAFAVSGVLTLLAAASLISHHQQVQAREMARSLTAVSGVVSLPSPEVLQDFEAIRHLNANPEPDERLLALFE
ncbi:MAG TPA: hypothetical protein VEH04_19335 [Verrucomicrobiae bacterium]|nr:hypothetical protein [Verrucomicrobiae bacterium]